MFKKILQWLKSLFSVDKKAVYYIGNGETLPSPLSAEEEKEYIIRLKNDDKEARTALIEHNLRLVVYIAKKFDNTKVEIEDLISVGTIGLIKAVSSFDVEKQIKLATYASRCIENEILMHLRKIVKMRNDVSLDEPLNVDWEGNVLLLSDVLGTDSDMIYNTVESDVDKDILIKSLEKLSARERQIIKMRFGILGTQKKTQKEIADLLGISQSYISRLEKKVMTRLKKEITKMV
ncbi:MAG: RNA polymerase sporulation sigma factor SigE [Clostridia bacterium]